jgi:hypothetical protein
MDVSAAGEPGAIRTLRKRRTRRVAFLWLLAAVFVGGNLWDWFGGHSWGPVQSTDQAIWVHASAALFWLAVAMLSLCLRDLASFLWHRSRPPTIEDLPEDLDWWNKRVANPARRFAARHRALIGVAGLFAGGALGHFLWKP